MKELRKFQCEHCNTVFDEEDAAMRCEGKHILYNDIVIVRAVHRRANAVTLDEGQWPSAIIVGLHNNRDRLIRYKYEDEEHWKGPDLFLSDQFYNPDSK